MRSSRDKKLLIASLFAVYCLVMLWLLFHRTPSGVQSYNLRPFKTIGEYLTIFARGGAAPGMIQRYALINCIGNVAVFIPLGIFLPLLFARERRFLPFLLTVILAVSAVEAIQLATTTGALDVDDLILNVIGAAFGWLGWRAVRQKR